MISWRGSIERDSPSDHIGSVSISSSSSSMGRQVKSVCFVFMQGHEVCNNTFSAQFPLNALISHLRKTFQSPLSTLLLIDLLPGCQVVSLSWRVCSALFIPRLCVSAWMCACSALSGHLERHQSDSPIPSKRPSSRSETTESPLSSKRPRTAEKGAAEQVRVTEFDVYRWS